MNRFTLAVAMAIIMTFLSHGIHAQTWTETGDAGDLLSTAQSTVGTGPLTTITGSLAISSPFDFVDIYCITITDTAMFSATSSAPATPLWLFDTSANGVTSQEGFYLNTPSKITGAFVTLPGIYYLGISMHDLLPDNPSSQNIWNTNPRSVETPPNGTGAPGPLTSWSFFGATSGVGAYTIELTGAAYGNCSVPEPGSLALLTCIGMSGTILLLCRSRRHGVDRV